MKIESGYILVVKGSVEHAIYQIRSLAWATYIVSRFLISRAVTLKLVWNTHTISHIINLAWGSIPVSYFESSYTTASMKRILSHIIREIYRT